MQQFCFRTEDPELISAILHELARDRDANSASKCSMAASLQALVLDGLALRRWAREQSAHHVYSVQQSASPVQHVDAEDDAEEKESAA